MAYRGRSRGYGSSGRSGKGKQAMAVLGALIGLAFGLWIFDKVLNVIIPIVNDSAFFGDTVTFIQDIIPVAGIIAGYFIIKPLFSSFQ